MRRDGTPIRVVVADDHPLMREAVVRSLEPDENSEVVAQLASGEAALAAIEGLRPDVAVLDLDLGDMSALDIVRQLTGEHETAVLILSAHTENALVHSAIAEGATGYLSKAASPEELADAVRLVAQGRLVVEPRLHEAVFAAVRDQGPARSGPELSDREVEVLRRAAAGDNERAIATALNVSQSTVKTYFRRLYDKLGVTDKASAVAAGVRTGVIK